MYDEFYCEECCIVFSQSDGCPSCDDGGSLELLKQPKQAFVHDTHEDLQDDLTEDAIAAGYFVVYKDGTVRTNWAYEAGITNLHLIGGVRALEIDLIKDEVEQNGG